MTIQGSIARQFDLVWETIDEIVAGVPEQAWTRGERGATTPAVQLAHLVGAVALYCCPTADGWPEWCRDPGGHFDWEVSAARLPTKDSFRRHCSSVRREVRQWLEQHGVTEFVRDPH